MRGLLKLTIGLAVLGGLLVGADRVAVGVAEDQAAEKLVSSGRMSARPDVSIDGFPFLTQAVAGEFDGVSLSANSVTVDDGQGDKVALSSFRAKLSGVSVSDSYRSATVRSGSGSGLISYQDLARLVQGGELALSYGGGDKVQASIAGVPVGTGRLHSQGNTVVADGFQLSGVAGMLAGKAGDLLHPRSFTLTGLPAGLNLASVTPQRDGVRLDFQGSDLKLIG